MASVWEELKRRNVVKVAVAYAIVGWMLVEVSATLLPAFEAPDWVLRVIVLFVVIGFILALVLSWAYELTPEGLKPAHEVDPAESITHVTGRKLDFIIIGVMALAIVFLVVNYVLVDEPQTATIEPESEVAVAAVEPALPPVEEEPQREVLPNSVAVLPFENLSLDPENAFFATGIHDTILNELAKISDVNVIARTAMLRYEDSDKSVSTIADELHVETIMEGSVQYANNRVRITAQLIDPESGSHLWSENYDRDFDDIFEIQSDIATRIALALKAELLPGERERIESRPTKSLEAYEYYLQALSLPRITSNQNVFDTYNNLLDQAIAADPEFAEAYAKKAGGYLGLQDLNGVLENVEKAIALDPALGNAYAVRGSAYYQYYFARQDDARADYERALELSPNDTQTLIFYGTYLASHGEHEEAIRMGNRALGLAPQDSELHYYMSYIYMYTGDYKAAAESLRESIRLNPGEGVSYMMLAIAQKVDGNLAAAKDNLNRARQIWQPAPVWGLGRMAYLYGLLDEPEEAARLLVQIENVAPKDPNSYVYRGDIARAIMGTGDTERALREWSELVDDYIEKDHPAGPYQINKFKLNVFQDPVLEEPEFLELRRRLGYRG